MSSTAMEATGVLPELEDELELEDEFELGGPAAEDEVAGLAREAVRAALGPLGGMRQDEFEDEFELEHEYENEYELEDEYELEGTEAMANPLRRVYPDAMMAHLAHAAAATESEAEAEAFIGALLPVASALFRRAAPAIMKAAPQIARGLGRVTRTLRGNPITRPLVDALPTVVKRTAGQLATQYSHGQPITAQGALRALAGQAGRVLTSPQQRGTAIRRTRALDRVHHRATYHQPGGVRQYPGGGYQPQPRQRRRRRPAAWWQRPWYGYPGAQHGMSPMMPPPPPWMPAPYSGYGD